MTTRIRFTSETGQLADVRTKVRAFLSENGFEDCAIELMVLAIDEACTNVIRHAYGHACKPVRMQLTSLRDKVRFVIRDYGSECDPSKIRGRALEDIRPGGLGVHIIREAFDGVTYSPQARGTRLLLEKARPA